MHIWPRGGAGQHSQPRAIGWVGHLGADERVPGERLDAVAVHPHRGTGRGLGGLLDLLHQHLLAVHRLGRRPHGLRVAPVLKNAGQPLLRKGPRMNEVRCGTARVLTKSTIPQPTVDCGSVSPDSLHGMMIVLRGGGGAAGGCQSARRPLQLLVRGGAAGGVQYRGARCSCCAARASASVD